MPGRAPRAPRAAMTCGALVSAPTTGGRGVRRSRRAGRAGGAHFRRPRRGAPRRRAGRAAARLPPDLGDLDAVGRPIARGGLPHARARPTRLLAGRPTARGPAVRPCRAGRRRPGRARRRDRRSRPPRSPRLGRGRGVGARRPAPRPGREPHLPVEPAPASVAARVAAASAGARGVVHRGDRDPGLGRVGARPAAGRAGPAAGTQRPVARRRGARHGRRPGDPHRDAQLVPRHAVRWPRPRLGRRARCSTSGGRPTTPSYARRPSAPRGGCRARSRTSSCPARTTGCPSRTSTRWHHSCCATSPPTPRSDG